MSKENPPFLQKNPIFIFPEIHVIAVKQPKKGTPMSPNNTTSQP
jgi:hypothetical protein